VHGSKACIRYVFVVEFSSFYRWEGQLVLVEESGCDPLKTSGTLGNVKSDEEGCKLLSSSNPVSGKRGKTFNFQNCRICSLKMW